MTVLPLTWRRVQPSDGGRAAATIYPGESSRPTPLAPGERVLCDCETPDRGYLGECMRCRRLIVADCWCPKCRPDLTR